MNMREIVCDFAVAEPFVERVLKVSVGEVFAPNGGEWLAGLDKRAVQIEQADKSRPLPGPVGSSENRPQMRAKAGENVMAVLPRRCREDEAGLWINLHEDVHALALRADEAVLQFLFVRVGTDNLDSLLRKRCGKFLFHVALCRPAGLVGGKA